MTEPRETQERERPVKCRQCVRAETWERSAVCVPCQDRGLT